jgi:hypothetical protein
MKAQTRILILIAVLAGLPSLAHALDAVRVVGDGGFGPEVVSTLHTLTETALRRRGVSGRSFVLRVGRLGAKIPLSLEETRADGSTLRLESLAATGIEEADTVVARLVEAVVGGKDVSSTARLKTVVEVETAEAKKLPSERHWTFGAPITPGGFYSAYTREAEHFRVDLALQGTGKFGESGSGAGFFGVGVVWLPSNGSFSPFIGGGAGMVWVDDIEGTGAHLEAGLELLRLHKMRFIVAGDVIIPGFDPRKDNRFADAKRLYPSLQLRVGF